MDTNISVRQIIVQQHKAGFSERNIAASVGLSKSTVHSILSRFAATGTLQVKRAGRCGRKRSLTARDDHRLQRESVCHPQWTAQAIRRSVGGTALNVSLRTVQRSLKRCGQITRRPLKSPNLTTSQMRHRVQWCRSHMNWTTEQWAKVSDCVCIPVVHIATFCVTLQRIALISCCFIFHSQVIFSDESAFDVAPPRPRVVRLRAGCHPTVAHTIQHRPQLQRVMLWGSISSKGVGPLVVITGTMNANKYQETLHQHLVPQINRWYGRHRHSCVFQQDNAPCHKAASVLDFFRQRGIDVMDWPPYSPDLSPIENMWAIVKQKLHQLPFHSKEELVEKLQELWHHDPGIADACAAVMKSMPSRIQACLKAHGGPIKY